MGRIKNRALNISLAYISSKELLLKYSVSTCIQRTVLQKVFYRKVYLNIYISAVPSWDNYIYVVRQLKQLYLSCIISAYLK